MQRQKHLTAATHETHKLTSSFKLHSETFNKEIERDNLQVDYIIVRRCN
jgi:hypothetical protein